MEFSATQKYIPEEAKVVLNNFIINEQVWILEFIEDFRILLKKWLEIHIQELTAYQRSELDEKNEAIYTLASESLSSHIENLDKVRVSL